MKKEVDELVTNAIRDFGKMIDIVKNAFGDSLPKSTTIDLVKNSIEGDVGKIIGIAKSVLGGDVDAGAIINLVSTAKGGDEDVGTIIDLVTGAVGGNATEDVSGLEYLNVPVGSSATEDVSGLEYLNVPVGSSATAPSTSVPPAMGSGLEHLNVPVGSDAMGSGLEHLNVPVPDAMGSGLDFMSVRDDRLSGADRPNDQAKKSGDASTVIDLVSAYARDSGAVGLFSTIGGIILGDRKPFVEETKNLGTLGSNIKAMLNAAASFLAGDPRPVLAALPPEVQTTMALLSSPTAFISNYIVGTGNRLVNLVLADPEAVAEGVEGFTVDGFIRAIAEPYIEEGKTILGAGERLIAAIKKIPGGGGVDVAPLDRAPDDPGAKLPEISTSPRKKGNHLLNFPNGPWHGEPFYSTDGKKFTRSPPLPSPASRTSDIDTSDIDDVQ